MKFQQKQQLGHTQKKIVEKMWSEFQMILFVIISKKSKRTWKIRKYGWYYIKNGRNETGFKKN